jgi:DNA invertase Pin-like site-specific DNA recombinase
MEKNQKVTAALGAAGPGGTCGTRRWRGVERAGRAERDEATRRLTAKGLSRRAIARAMDINVAAVARAQRAGGAS